MKLRAKRSLLSSFDKFQRLLFSSMILFFFFFVDSLYWNIFILSNLLYTRERERERRVKLFEYVQMLREKIGLQRNLLLLFLIER